MVKLSQVRTSAQPQSQTHDSQQIDSETLPQPSDPAHHTSIADDDDEIVIYDELPPRLESCNVLLERLVAALAQSDKTPCDLFVKYWMTSAYMINSGSSRRPSGADRHWFFETHKRTLLQLPSKVVEELTQRIPASLNRQNRHALRSLARSNFWDWDILAVYALLRHEGCTRCILEAVKSMGDAPFESRDQAMRMLYEEQDRRKRTLAGKATGRKNWQRADVTKAIARVTIRQNSQDRPQQRSGERILLHSDDEEKHVGRQNVVSPGLEHDGQSSGASKAGFSGRDSNNALKSTQIHQNSNTGAARTAPGRHDDDDNDDDDDNEGHKRVGRDGIYNPADDVIDNGSGEEEDEEDGSQGSGGGDAMDDPDNRSREIGRGCDGGQRGEEDITDSALGSWSNGVDEEDSMFDNSGGHFYNNDNFDGTFQLDTYDDGDSTLLKPSNTQLDVHTAEQFHDPAPAASTSNQQHLHLHLGSISNNNNKHRHIDIQTSAYQQSNTEHHIAAGPTPTAASIFSVPIDTPPILDPDPSSMSSNKRPSPLDPLEASRQQRRRLEHEIARHSSIVPPLNHDHLLDTWLALFPSVKAVRAPIPADFHLTLPAQCCILFPTPPGDASVANADAAMPTTIAAIAHLRLTASESHVTTWIPKHGGIAMQQIMDTVQALAARVWEQEALLADKRPEDQEHRGRNDIQLSHQDIKDPFGQDSSHLSPEQQQCAVVTMASFMCLDSLRADASADALYAPLWSLVLRIATGDLQISTADACTQFQLPSARELSWTASKTFVPTTTSDSSYVAQLKREQECAKWVVGQLTAEASFVSSLESTAKCLVWLISHLQDLSFAEMAGDVATMEATVTDLEAVLEEHTIQAGYLRNRIDQATNAPVIRLAQRQLGEAEENINNARVELDAIKAQVATRGALARLQTAQATIQQLLGHFVARKEDYEQEGKQLQKQLHEP